LGDISSGILKELFLGFTTGLFGMMSYFGIGDKDFLGHSFIGAVAGLGPGFSFVNKFYGLAPAFFQKMDIGRILDRGGDDSGIQD
jgi:hypothetical protein